MSSAYSVKKRTPPPTKKRPSKPKFYREKGPKPSRHDHVNNMVFDTDFCACRVCEQAWQLTDKGWVFIKRHRDV